jgi:NifU-like protein involved in Fe-S cluster formation
MPGPAFEEHFRNPRHAGALAGADGKVEVENPVCGDLLNFYWKLSKNFTVEQASFQVYGCPASIAAGSMLTELVLNRDRGQLAQLRAEEIAQALGGLSRESFHAAVLAADAVQAMVSLMDRRQGLNK